MQNINSFSENVSRLTGSADKILAVAEAMNESITGNAPEVYLSDDIKLPSFANVLRRLDRRLIISQ